jgi:hypothetical protein
VGAPQLLPRRDVERGEPAVDAHLAAGIPHENLAVDGKGGHGHRHPAPGIVHSGPPDLLAGLDVDRDRFGIEQIVDQFAVVEGPAAKHRVATRLADRDRRRVGLKGPLH